VVCRTVAGVPASRARSFGAVAAAYAQHRPGYPDAAVSWALQPVARLHPLQLLDLGAGTGKLTAALLDRGQVTAVDPDPAMLRELRSRFPGLPAREGSAEEIPLPDASMDAVLVGQAWHWFDPDRAFPELARVLRPGGVLAALWNGDDTTVEWVAGLHDAVDGERVARVRAADEPAFPEHPAFAPSAHSLHPNPVRTTVAGLIDTLATHSWALVCDPADRDAVFTRMRTYLAARPETSAGEFVLPLVTDVMRTLRR
jgi:SAM-dependent methyltransferase